MSKLLFLMASLIISSASNAISQEFSLENLGGSSVEITLKRNGVVVCSGVYQISGKYTSICRDEMQDQPGLGGVVSYDIEALVTLPSGNQKKVRYVKEDFDEVQSSLGCFPLIGRETEDPGDLEIRFSSVCG